MKPQKEEVFDWFKSLIWAIVIAIVIRTFFIGNFKIPSASMVPTLKIGDRLLANKFIYKVREPRRGEVVIFKYPEDPKRDFVKRLIALPGERVRIKDGKIHINGRPTDNDLVDVRYYYSDGYYGIDRETEVPPDCYFVLGDNSINSKDSRYWGFVPKKLMEGKALFMYWPPWRMGAIR